MKNDHALGSDLSEPRESHAFTDEMAGPEIPLLRAVFGVAPFVTRLARAPGGWRTLSDLEIEGLGVTLEEKNSILALQVLTRRSYPELPKLKFVNTQEVGRVYCQRLGGLAHEVMLVVALDGHNNFLAEIEVAVGGAHGVAMRPRDILRPVVRAGASAFLLVHNHPSGDPTPSEEDIELTGLVAECGDMIDVPLVDHVVVGARGGGFVSFQAPIKQRGRPRR